MLFVRIQNDSKPRWNLIDSSSERLLAKHVLGEWQCWLLGSVPEGVVEQIGHGLRSGEPPRQILADLRQRHNGHFAVFLLDEQGEHFLVGVDPYAIVRVYIAEAPDGLAVGTRLVDLLRHCRRESLNILPQPLAYFLVNGYTPSRHTFWREIRKIPPATVVSFLPDKEEQHDYAQLLAPTPPLAANDYLAWFEGHWRGVLEPWLNRFSDHIVALSGGVDSTVLLAALLDSGMPKDRTVIRTIRYQASRPCLDNELDVEYSRRVAEHYGIKHEIVSYDTLDDRILDDYLHCISTFGSEFTLGTAFFKAFDAGQDGHGCVYSGQNADSVLSFGLMGHPALSLHSPFVSGLGGWCARFYLYGGFHEKRWRPERPVVRTLLDRFLRRRYGTRFEALTSDSFLLGAALEPGNWPYLRNHESFSFLEDPDSLANWFRSEYLQCISPETLENAPHAVFEWIYLHTYMQGAANRFNTWGALENGSNVLLPFTTLALLRETARVKVDGRFYWYGKFPNVYYAKRQESLPRFVLNRTDGPESLAILAADFFRNRRMNEYIHHLMEHFDPGRFAGILKSELLKPAHWARQLALFEACQYQQMDLKLFPRVMWLLAMEDHARS